MSFFTLHLGPSFTFTSHIPNSIKLITFESKTLTWRSILHDETIYIEKKMELPSLQMSILF